MEQVQFWGIGNIENKYFDLGKKGKCLFISREQGNRYPQPLLRKGSLISFRTVKKVNNENHEIV